MRALVLDDETQAFTQDPSSPNCLRVRSQSVRCAFEIELTQPKIVILPSSTLAKDSERSTEPVPDRTLDRNASLERLVIGSTRLVILRCPARPGLEGCRGPRCYGSARSGVRGSAQNQTHKLDSVLHAELMHDVGTMKFHRARTYLERSGCFLARGSLHDLRQYDLLARRQ